VKEGIKRTTSAREMSTALETAAPSKSGCAREYHPENCPRGVSKKAAQLISLMQASGEV